MRTPCQRLTLALVVLVFCLLGPAPASYADGNPSDAGEASSHGDDDSSHTDQADDSNAKDGPLSKLSYHAYASVAAASATFGVADDHLPPTVDERALGISEDDTFDYWTLALHLQYKFTAKDIVTLQVGSRGLGDSPIGDLDDDIDLDWAFYERRLGRNTSVKIGRVPVPLGIFNESRDFGTDLPFWRVPYTFYGEGNFTSETVDGAVITHTFASRTKWGLEASAYYGGWEIAELDPAAGESAYTAKAPEAYGFQLWQSTPVTGLRFGLASYESEIEEGDPAVRLPDETQKQSLSYLFSVDYGREKFVARAEYARREHDSTSLIFGSDFDFWHIQLGYHPTEKIRVYVQAEQGMESIDQRAFTDTGELPLTESIDRYPFRKDLGIAVSYLLFPNMVLKLEHHQVEAESLGLSFVLLPSGPALQPFFNVIEDGDYTILSFSASF